MSRKGAAKPADKPLRLDWVRADTLTANPANWRRHPQSQLDGLRQSIGDESVGWAGALLYNERTGRLVDGHGRLSIVAPDAVVPVLVGSWDDAGERRILATLDPLTGLAETDHEAIRRLLDDTDFADGTALADLTTRLGEQLTEFAADVAGGDEGADDPPAPREPDGGSGADDNAEWQTQYKLLLVCRDEAHQADLLDAMDRPDAPDAGNRLAGLLRGVVVKVLVT